MNAEDVCFKFNIRNNFRKFLQQDTSDYFWLTKINKLCFPYGPAAFHPNSDCMFSYFKDNLLHRKDGPAEVYQNGKVCYYLNGEQYGI